MKDIMKAITLIVSLILILFALKYHSLLLALIGWFIAIQDTDI